MRIGVYVDGFNLYYGARKHCGRGTPGWRWLDLRALVEPLIGWRGGEITRIVYCTARVDAVASQTGAIDQNVYLDALATSGSVDVIAEGRYVSWAKEEPLVNEPAGTYRPTVYRHGGEHWDEDLPLRRALASDGRADSIMATVQKREEKGSDVNVVSHLLLDVLTKAVDGVVIVSNDSDFELPLRMVRDRVPVGTVNPSTSPTAGALRGRPDDGVGGHWWRRLRAEDYRASQLPDRVGMLRKPDG
ncbi:NYN domain-containing protein [Leifsonia sp. F6_8S_P_1B]|uniref:NYN domain-containing protein n=1 Tax=Leifsonia williamsii TaxID=3035919 RepID=A0ABT8K8T5_9MICO|nr:NYN domain-containing protein [Leifsonia williamsii]MDN4613447.1 NYN domain-containing protein [Leifsonia williamsii]